MADKAELKIKDFEIYRAYYCGICKSVGRRFGQIPRLAISYDFAFLAILLASLSDDKENIELENCLIHPAKKIKVIRNDRFVDYAADIMLLLVYYNLLDDKADEHKVRGTFGSLLLSHHAKRLARKYEEISKTIESQLMRLSDLEKQKSKSLDETGDAFAKIMAEVFASEHIGHLFDQTDKLRILRHLGGNLGRWIYLVDALDDIADDIKNGSYNPLVLRYEYDADAETVQEFKARIKDDIDMVLLSCLSEIGNAYTLLDIKKNKGVLDNIIYLGLLKKTESLEKTDLVEGRIENEKSI